MYFIGSTEKKNDLISEKFKKDKEIIRINFLNLLTY